MKNWARAASIWLGAGLLVAGPFAHAQDEAEKTAGPGQDRRRCAHRSHHPDGRRARLPTGSSPSANAVSRWSPTTRRKAWKARETPVTRTLTGVAFSNSEGRRGRRPWRLAGAHRGWRRDLATHSARRNGLGLAARRRASRRRSLRRLRRVRPVFRFGGRAARPGSARMILGEEFDRHISQVVPAGPSLFLVAESGTLARSDDGGATWTALTSPYVGLVFRRRRDERRRDPGLRHARQHLPERRSGRYLAADRHSTTKTSMNAGRQLADGRILLVGNSGLLALSRDGGQTLRSALVAGRSRFCCSGRSRGGTVVLAGEAGITLLDPSLARSPLTPARSRGHTCRTRPRACRRDGRRDRETGVLGRLGRQDFATGSSITASRC